MENVAFSRLTALAQHPAFVAPIPKRLLASARHGVRAGQDVTGRPLTHAARVELVLARICSDADVLLSELMERDELAVELKHLYFVSLRQVARDGNAGAHALRLVDLLDRSRRRARERDAASVAA